MGHVDSITSRNMLHDVYAQRVAANGTEKDFKKFTRPLIKAANGGSMPDNRDEFVRDFGVGI